MIYVYDASYICALIIPDESSATIDNQHRAIDENDIVFSPQLLWYEISNTFRNLNRRKRYPIEVISHYFKALAIIELNTDYMSGAKYAAKIWQLGNDYNLTAYDAAYLELAERKNAILCTLDVDLLNAAKKHGVKTLETT